MNKRINELAIKAGGIWQGGYVEQANGNSVYTDKKFVNGGDMDVEQFARLLVKECMAISSDAMTNDNWPPHMIAKHFGVEE
jgi:hypothetical protein